MVTTAKAKNEVSPLAKTTEYGTGLNCVVAKGTSIDGHFKSTENVRMDGSLTGDINCEKKLVLGETGRVEGKIIAGEAVVMGHVVGELNINGVLHLHSTANIEGDIVAKKIIVEEGARYNGACKIG